jgi:Metallo-peptidase family M12B Reprolysin-like/Fibronectin type III domain
MLPRSKPLVSRAALGSAFLLASLVAMGTVLPASARPDDNAIVTSFAVASTPVKDSNGIVGRRVADVVREQQSVAVRSRTAQSISPLLAKFADDPTAYLDSSDRVFVAEAFDLAAPIAGLPETAFAVGPQVTGDAFALHSRPGSSKTVYLDFDGAVTTNSAWNNSYSIPTIVSSPFDRDGSPTTFNTTERQYIIDVWRVVSEDFAPFDVDITTQLPSEQALLQDSFSDPVYGINVVVTPDKSWVCNSCGGIAYIGVFSDYPYYSPAWVFPTSSVSASSLGSVVSHEVGHNFGLGHDGVTGGATYYGGHGDWSPIMGSSTRAFTQWSKGEYTNANETEDDLAQIASYTGFVEDLDGGSFATAAPVGVSTTATVTMPQTTIRSSSDADFWSVTANNGFVKASVQTSGLAPNLLPKVSLYNGAAQLLQSRTMTGTSGVVSVEATGIAPGTYFAVVESASLLTPTNGFSSYGSIGLYTLTVETAVAPIAPATVGAMATGDRALTVSWSASTTPSGQIPLSYAVQLCETTAGTCTTTIETTSLSQTVGGLEPSLSYTATVRTKGFSGALSAPATSSSVQVKAKPVAPSFNRVRFDEANRILTVEWCCVVGYAPVGVANVMISVVNVATSEVATASVASNVSTATISIPMSWGNPNIIVQGVSRSTAVATVWENSDLVSTGAMLFGRPVATQSSGSSPSQSRNGASTSGTVTATGRAAAPQT